jgi:hypothetical protein
MQPSLVFVVPAFNAAGTVGETIRSVLAQTRGDVGAVVVDDGSSDETGAVAARAAAADPRVRLVRQENRGLAGARNRGVAELLGGMYAGPVCFLDADDVVSPRYAAVMLDALGENDAVACACRMAGPRLEDVGWVIRSGDHDLRADRMLEFNPLAVGAVTVRLETLVRLGLIGPRGVKKPGPFDSTLTVHEDWDLWLRLTAAGARWSPVVSEPLFTYRMLAGSMSGALEKMFDVGVRVIERAPVDARLKPGALRRWAIRHVARAAARGDVQLTRLFAARVAGTWSDEDLETLAGALRWALCQEHQTGPACVTPEQESAWRARAVEFFAGMPRVERVLSRLRFTESRWTRVADAFLDRLEGGATGVIYGMGRNGRDLIAAVEGVLERCMAGRPRGALPRMAWVDDDPSAEAPTLLGRTVPRLRPDALTERHIVVVTPERRGEILAQLQARGVTARTPEELVQPEALGSRNQD